MDELFSSYGESSSSDSESSSPIQPTDPNHKEESTRLPPPPIDLLTPQNSLDLAEIGTGSRVRSFPHVDGNYALHVSIPVGMDSQSDFQVDGKSNGNLFWSEGMDRVLVHTLQKQLSLGNKSKSGWKSIAFTAVINNMWRKRHIKIKKDHIMNRLKTWRKMNVAVKELLGLDGFSWDGESKTLRANEDVWRNALKTRKHLRQYKGKALAFYQEIAQLIGDEAKGPMGITHIVTNEERTATEKVQDDLLGGDRHLDGWTAGDVRTEIPVQTHASSSSSPSRAGEQTRRKRKRFLVPGWVEEMSKVRLEIGRVASAMECRNQIDDPLWDQCTRAIEAINDLDEDAKLAALEMFLGSLDKRRMFISLKDSQRRTWILRKFGRSSL
ncbi:hypothetical protein IFM89_025140 [Coptis chinensis]|uniref:Myb/SANT-like domain-containing protein n=1 Tax=Coptis chinensis TaxID=261450 RepID=A0A835IV18_9MAGN|nr:hypothetical protein IFM89_025140 [Coptis chinensis]